MGKLVCLEKWNDTLFIKRPLIFENAKYFFKYLDEIYEKEARENAGTK